MYHQKEWTVMVRLLEIHNYLMLHLIQHYSVILPKELSQDLLWMAVGSHTHLKKEVRLEAEPRVIHNYLQELHYLWVKEVIHRNLKEHWK